MARLAAAGGFAPQKKASPTEQKVSETQTVSQQAEVKPVATNINRPRT